jgi:cytochrome c1
MRRFTKHLAVLAILGWALAIAGVVYAATVAKKYQVTGVVTSVTDKMVVVQKPNDEKWEIDRDSDTKTTGDLKVGAKVTIEYTMTAASITVK